MIIWIAIMICAIFIFKKKYFIYTFFKNEWRVHTTNCRQKNALISIISIILMRNQIIEKVTRKKNIKDTSTTQYSQKWSFWVWEIALTSHSLKNIISKKKCFSMNLLIELSVLMTAVCYIFTKRMTLNITQQTHIN